MLQCSQKYGSRFFLWLGIDPVISITDPEDAAIVLSSQELIYKSNNYTFAANWLGDGLLLAGGPKWQRARKFLTPAFHFNVLKQFKGAMAECSDVLIHRLETQCSGKAVDIYPFVGLFALDVICETALGVKKHAQENSTSRYVSAVQGQVVVLNLTHSLTHSLVNLQNLPPHPPPVISLSAAHSLLLLVQQVARRGAEPAEDPAR